MTENGADDSRHEFSEAPTKGDSVLNDIRPFKTSLADNKSCKEHDALKLSENAKGEKSAFQPRPPLLPRLSKSSISGSLEKSLRSRRQRSSQESLSDQAETGSSTDSLKEDQTVATTSNRERPVSAVTTGSPGSRGRASSLSEEERPHSQQSEPSQRCMMPPKVLLSPLQPTGPLPALEKSLASATLRAANRIDRDCLDYAMLVREKHGDRLHRNLSDSRLLENMGSDSASVNSLRSNYSVLSPIRPQDVRNRYSM